MDEQPPTREEYEEQVLWMEVHNQDPPDLTYEEYLAVFWPPKPKPN